LTWSHALDRVVIAMAGIHQLWTFDPITGAIMVLAGTTQEGLVDGPAVTSWWAQPSGLDELPDGRIVVADSETSAVRVLDPRTMQVSTLVGQGLFDFGHVDGPAGSVRLQHPLAVTALPDGRIAVSDTYNGAIRLIEEAPTDGAGTATGGITALSGVVAVADQPGGTGEEAAAAGEAHVVTVATDLKEPSDAIVGPPVDGIGQLIVVESGAHRITWVPVAKAAERVIDEGAQRSERPATEVGPGPLTVRVLLTPPPGHKLDDPHLDAEGRGRGGHRARAHRHARPRVHRGRPPRQRPRRLLRRGPGRGVPRLPHAPAGLGGPDPGRRGRPGSSGPLPARLTSD